MKGISFYFHLRQILQEGNIVGNRGNENYVFMKWMDDGALQFQINLNQKKSIPAELIIAACYARGRQIANNPPIIVNDNWVMAMGQDNWCFDEVLNYVLDNY